jgi:glycosyltransferase involved in cell wall biosynthesis
MKGIEVISPIFDISGTTQVGRNIVLALQRIGVTVKLTPVTTSKIITELTSQEGEILDSLRSTKAEPDWPALYLIPPHLIPHVKTSAKNISLTVFETNSCPGIWPLIVEQQPLDGLWTASEFGKQSFINGGIPEEKIKVIPFGIDTKKFHPDITALGINNLRGFNFLTTMELKDSKGYDILLDAYFKEFSDKDDVTLIFKAYMGDFTPARRKYIKDMIYSFKTKHNSKAKVILIDQHIPEFKMPNLYKAADCYVLPTRGEGWSLGTISSMACGIPVITTDKTGHMQYCNDKNSLLIPSKETPIKSIKWLLSQPMQIGHNWYEPDMLMLRKLMRWAYEHKSEMKQLGKKARHDVEQFNWEATAQKIADNLLGEVK